MQQRRSSPYFLTSVKTDLETVTVWVTRSKQQSFKITETNKLGTLLIP